MCLTVAMQPLVAPMAQRPYDVTSYPYVTPKRFDEILPLIGEYL
jgi:hypothetical protein